MEYGEPKWVRTVRVDVVDFDTWSGFMFTADSEDGYPHVWAVNNC